MTFIKPKKTLTIWNVVIGGLATLAVVGTFLLIGLYNGVVNANHAIAAAKTQLDSIGAENTSLNNKLIGVLGSGAVAQAAQQDNLVEEKNPEYFQDSASKMALR